MLKTTVRKTSTQTMRRHNEIGFTLIEVMAALLITTLAAAALIGSISQTIDARAHIQQLNTGTFIAENTMEETLLSYIENQKIQDEHGDITIDQTNWSWSTNISATDTKHILRLEVRVFHDTNKEPITSLVRLINAPGT